MNIRQKVMRYATIPPAILAVVCIAIVIIFFYMNQRTIQRENSVKASSVRMNYNEFKTRTSSYALIISSYESVQRGVGSGKRHMITAVTTPLFENMDVDIITVHEKDGYVIAMGQDPDNFAQDESDMPYVKNALQGRPTYGIVKINDKMALISTEPVMHGGVPSGAVTVGYYLDNDFARNLFSLVGAHVIITQNNKPIASSIPDPYQEIGDKKKKSLPDEISDRRYKIRANSIRYDLSHVKIQQDEDNVIKLVLATDNNEIRRILVILFVGCLVITLLIFLALVERAFKFTNELTSPIENIARNADMVAHGELDVELLNVESSDEIGKLTESFNVMVSNLRNVVDKDKRQREYLEQQVERLTEVIDAAAHGDFEARFEGERDDAFSKIGRALNQMISDLDSMIRNDQAQREYLEMKVAELLDIINSAAQGDFSKYYQGEADDQIGRLGISLSEMIVDLQSMIEMNKSRRSYLEGQVSSLLEVIEAASEGDFSKKFEVKRNDEIGRVGKALNEMTGQLKDRLEQIESMKLQDRDQKEKLEIQVKEILLGVAQVADGDLTVQMPIRAQDEGIINELKKNLNFMFKRLRDLVAKVRESSEAVEKTSAAMQKITQQLENGATNQASLLENAAKFVKHMTVSFETVSKHSNDMLKIAEQTNEDAAEGGETTKKAVVGMNQIGEAVEEIEVMIKDLETSAEEIEGIVKVIDEISDQTNLLALNASIEAARAGEYGRGFSVVAKEISSLASKSTESTREIANIVRSIQERIKKANQSMSRGHTKVEEGSRMVNLAGTALEQILESITGVTGLIKQTSESIDQRSGETVRIESAIKEILKISEETSHLAERTKKAVDSLNAMSGELDTFVRQIKLGME